MRGAYTIQTVIRCTTLRERDEIKKLRNGPHQMSIEQLSWRFKHDSRTISAVLRFSETDIKNYLSAKENEGAESAFTLSNPVTPGPSDRVLRLRRKGDNVGREVAEPRKEVLGSTRSVSQERTHSGDEQLPLNSSSRGAAFSQPSISATKAGITGDIALCIPEGREDTNVNPISYLPLSFRQPPQRSRVHHTGQHRLLPAVKVFVNHLVPRIPDAPKVFRDIGITNARHLDALARKLSDVNTCKPFSLDLQQEFERRGVELTQFLVISDALQARSPGDPVTSSVTQTPSDALSAFLQGLGLSLLHHRDALHEAYIRDGEWLDFLSAQVDAPGAEYYVWHLKTHKKLQSITPLEWLFLLHGLRDQAVRQRESSGTPLSS